MSAERALGMDRPIARRDLLQGAAVAVMGGSAAAAEAPDPPLLQGLRGSAPGSFEAALLGRDRSEMVTILPLAEEARWTTYIAARLAMRPNLSRRDVAPRYRAAA